MRNTIRIAALVLGGLAFIGCDKKETSTTSTPEGTSTTVTTPSGTSTTTDTSAQQKLNAAANNAGDTIKSGADKVGQSVSNGVDNVKSGAQNLGDKMSATTMPSMPSMGK